MTTHPSAKTSQRWRKALRFLARASELASRPEVVAARSERVSRWSIGHHLEHLALADSAILDGLEKILADDPATQKPRHFTVAGRILLTLGRIPRGRGQAPKALRPKGLEQAELAALSEHQHRRLGALGERLSDIASSSGTHPHPLFGQLTILDWLRFLSIHHRHHERIILDIQRAWEAGKSIGT